MTLVHTAWPRARGNPEFQNQVVLESTDLLYPGAETTGVMRRHGHGFLESDGLTPE